MANPSTSEKSNALDREENITKGNLSAKKVALYTYDANTDELQPVTSLGGSSSTVVWGTNDIEDDTTSYFGQSTASGTWRILKLTDTSVSYATVSNNGTVTSYTDAWTNRATLTFERFDEAF